MQTVELCRRCGFHLPVGQRDCPACATPAPSLAARQVAGLELPTRSVHPQPRLRPNRELYLRRTRRRIGHDLFAFATLLGALALVCWTASFFAGIERIEVQLHDGTAARLGDAARMLGWATLALLALAGVAVAVRQVRLRRRRVIVLP
jgi:hypothetical protein